MQVGRNILPQLGRRAADIRLELLAQHTAAYSGYTLRAFLVRRQSSGLLSMGALKRSVATHLGRCVHGGVTEV